MSNAAEKLVVPALGESVTEATVSTWLKQVGDSVEEDETIVELETDKVTMEVNAPKSGVLKEIKAAEGATVEVGDLLGYVEAGAVAAPVKAPAKDEKPKEEEKSEEKPKAEEDSKPEEKPKPESKPQAANQEAPLSPAVRRMVSENDLDPSSIPATGKNGRITKEDVMAVMSGAAQRTTAGPAGKDQDPREERVAMTRLRQTVAKRLKDAQNTAAILTTFNEVDMSAVMDLRNRTKEQFEKKHGVKLGFMSFFVKACVEGLKEIPAVNAEIQGTDILYKNHYDVSVAIGAPQGLVVPVIRDADRKAFWEIEQDIADYAAKAKDGKLTMDDMSGGTFTVSNGGVFGSLLSTPILNPPQSGILGMHKTEMRAVVVDGKVEVRPMMYLALSYDHRIIDGKEAVTFLVRVKECIENPDRMLLNV